MLKMINKTVALARRVEAVTDGEPKVMSASVPSKIHDVEAAIARLKQELAAERAQRMR